LLINTIKKKWKNLVYKKPRQEHIRDNDDTAENLEEWMISYLDLVTLLLVFFVSLIAFANFSAAPLGDQLEKKVKPGALTATLMREKFAEFTAQGSSSLVVPSYEGLLYKLKLLRKKTT
jgi:flagellar motor protein MotB